jgi:hypothetical protein
VLASPTFSLAHEVLAGGVHSTAKAIELAEKLLMSLEASIITTPATGSTRGTP